MSDVNIMGTRIRQRRVAIGMKQGELAARVNVSPSYLNLIEHNRRRIAGKLLVKIANALGTNAETIEDVEDVGLVDALHGASNVLQKNGATINLEDPLELVSRLPGWAQVVVGQKQVIEEQSALISALTDRLRHDPQLANALHEVLSVITSVRSTSGILAQERDIEPVWQERFQRNLFEDSQRLADSAKSLVAFLEEVEPNRSGAQSLMPTDLLNVWMDKNNHYFSTLEGTINPEAEIELVLKDAGLDESAKEMAYSHLLRYREDAEAIPLTHIWDTDPVSLAAATQSSVETAIRRIFVNEKRHGREAGLVSCDSAGAIQLRSLPSGFVLPAIGFACPLLPLFQAMQTPNRPVRSLIEQAGYAPRVFLTYASATPILPPTIDRPQVFHATMLIVPVKEQEGERAELVGQTCRTCPRATCAARREPSVL